MNRFFRRFLVPSLAVVGALAAMPSVARADDFHERSRFEHERFERERRERERREHQWMCERAYEHGASRHRLREMGCYVR